MIIASRRLPIRNHGRTRAIDILLHRPERQDGAYSCIVDIHWPGAPWSMAVYGRDSVQALLLGLQTVGAKLYLSLDHREGRLGPPGSKGYGFPVHPALRDLLGEEDLTAV